MQGKQLSEMFDMAEAGAVAFSDDKGHVGTELMTRALEYSNNFGGLIISFPHDNGVNAQGLIHEGAASVSLGLQGIPSIAEELRLQRDIELLKYTGGRLHVSMISTSRSVELIRKAKKDKLNITCGIAAHQLSFSDDDLSGFDSNLKVLPPFRTKNDHKALIAGLKDGTIDVICSDHTPEDVEHKVREFEDANFGISSLETAFSTIWNQVSELIPIEDIISKLTDNPAQILHQKTRQIAEGYNEGITVFTTDEYATFSSSEWQSKSKNSPFIDQTLKGKVLMMG
jgi:dihydroorotase